MEILFIAAIALYALLINIINRIETTPLDESQLVTVNNDSNMENYTKKDVELYIMEFYLNADRNILLKKEANLE